MDATKNKIKNYRVTDKHGNHANSGLPKLSTDQSLTVMQFMQITKGTTCYFVNLKSNFTLFQRSAHDLKKREFCT